ncbi:MAG: hypothetical protein HFJ41_06025 [Clostridia bacterium]|nr:hypothetical protein [Clostridia bacterium]
MKKNNEKMTKKNIIESIIILILLNIFLFTYYITKQSNLLLLFNILIVIYIIVKAKYSMFTIKILILNYILSPIYFQYNFGNSYGVLQSSNIPLYYVEINTILIIYNVITCLVLINSNILEKEKELLKLRPKTSKVFSNICSIIAIIFAIVAIPSLPFKSFGETVRFNHLLPGDAWNHLVIISLIFAYPNLKESKMVKFSYIFCILWFLAHYERVDIIGIIILIVILSICNIKNKISIKQIMKYGLILITVLLVLVFIGEARVNNKSNINFIRKILIQNTASDLGYIYNVSVEYAKNEKLLKGKTYLAYVVEAIPLIPSQQRIERFLEKQYNTPGGSYLLSEPLVNFGIIGVIIFSLLEFFIINLILNMKSSYRFYVYCFIIVAIFRICWYGVIYVEIGLLYFIPLLFLMKHIIETKIIKNKVSIE